MKNVRNLFAIMTGALLAGVSSLSMAALPVSATTALTDVQTDGLALIDAVWPVVAAITIGFVILKLFKRGVNKV